MRVTEARRPVTGAQGICNRENKRWRGQLRMQRSYRFFQHSMRARARERFQCERLGVAKSICNCVASVTRKDWRGFRVFASVTASVTAPLYL